MTQTIKDLDWARLGSDLRASALDAHEGALLRILRPVTTDGGREDDTDETAAAYSG